MKLIEKIVKLWYYFVCKIVIGGFMWYEKKFLLFICNIVGFDICW